MRWIVARNAMFDLSKYDARGFSPQICLIMPVQSTFRYTDSRKDSEDQAKAQTLYALITEPDFHAARTNSHFAGLVVESLHLRTA